MSDIDLKVYTRYVKELETAVYTQRSLMKEHERVIDSQIPQEPVRKQFSITRPVEPSLLDYTRKLEYKKELVLGVMLFSLGVFCIVGAFIISGIIYGIIGLVSLLIGCSLLKDTINAISTNQEVEKSGKIKYNLAKEEYNKSLDEYIVTVERAERQYKESYESYKRCLLQYKQNKLEIERKHKDALYCLEKALESLYSEDIIFPKYRNLVAITAINEYLESGRCSSLEGPDGAYNLYEMELRQNIIIGKLSNIISDLEQIRSNQFSLYEELKKSNEKVDDIIYELKILQKDTKLNAYFNYVTAVAETSPKIYYGLSY